MSTKQKVYIIYKPGCGWSEKALSMLMKYKEKYPNDIEIMILPTKKINSVSIFCDTCGLCSNGETFPQIWIGKYDEKAKKVEPHLGGLQKLSECTGYVGGCTDLMKLMTDLGFAWPLEEEKVVIKWGLVKSYWNNLYFDDLFENFFLLHPTLYYWG